MRRAPRLVLWLCVAVVSGTLVTASTMAPAHAQEVCAGFGAAHLSSPFVYPVFGQTDGNTTPPFTVTVTPHSATFTAHLTTGSCAPSLTQLSASGTVHGWCGLSTGTGITSTGHAFSWVGIGGFLVVTGAVTGVVTATPSVVAGDSCVTGADDFFVSGVVVLKQCLVVNTPSSTSTVLSTTSLDPWPFSIHSGGPIHFHLSTCV